MLNSLFDYFSNSNVQLLYVLELFCSVVSACTNPNILQICIFPLEISSSLTCPHSVCSSCLPIHCCTIWCTLYECCFAARMQGEAAAFPYTAARSDVLYMSAALLPGCRGKQLPSYTLLQDVMYSIWVLLCCQDAGGSSCLPIHCCTMWCTLYECCFAARMQVEAAAFLYTAAGCNVLYMSAALLPGCRWKQLPSYTLLQDVMYSIWVLLCCQDAGGSSCLPIHCCMMWCTLYECFFAARMQVEAAAFLYTAAGCDVLYMSAALLPGCRWKQLPSYTLLHDVMYSIWVLLCCQDAGGSSCLPIHCCRMWCTLYECCFAARMQVEAAAFLYTAAWCDVLYMSAALLPGCRWKQLPSYTLLQDVMYSIWVLLCCQDAGGSSCLPIHCCTMWYTLYECCFAARMQVEAAAFPYTAAWCDVLYMSAALLPGWGGSSCLPIHCCTMWCTLYECCFAARMRRKRL